VKIYRFFLVLLATISLGSLLFAQDDDLLKHRFKTALDSYNSGDYGTAENILRSLRSNARSTSYYPITLYMQGLSAYKDGKYDLAVTLFNEFSSIFPDHPLYHRAKIFTGNALYALGDYIASSKEFILSFSSKDDQEKKIAQDSFKNLLWGYLTIDQLYTLLEEIPSMYKMQISYYIVLRLEEAGLYSQALKEGESLVVHYPGSQYIPELKNINKRIGEKLATDISIGVVLPLSGEFSDFGNSVYDGIKLAVKQYEQRTGNKITLLSKDSQGDPLRCVQITDELINSSHPLSIIGPLTSEEAVVLGTLGKSHNIPIITPTASRSDLASISHYFFQTEVSPKNATRELIKYSCDSLGDTTFAILAPRDNVGGMLSDVAVGVIEAKGLDMIAVEYYDRDIVDFSEVLSEIKEPLLKRLDRMVAHADTTDSIFYNDKFELKSRQEWDVHIDALFLPGYIDELVNVLPQIPFNYIDTRILGCNGWIVDELLVGNTTRYTDSVIFVPDQYYIDSDDVKWNNFEKLFEKEFYKKPDRLAGQGYDSANLILSGIESGALTPEILRKYLSEIKNYEGVAQRITFDSNGGNTEVRLFQFDRKKVNRIN